MKPSNTPMRIAKFSRRSGRSTCSGPAVDLSTQTSALREVHQRYRTTRTTRTGIKVFYPWCPASLRFSLTPFRNVSTSAIWVPLKPYLWVPIGPYTPPIWIWAKPQWPGGTIQRRLSRTISKRPTRNSELQELALANFWLPTGILSRRS